MIKTREIEGDVAISRHVATGGNATVQGHATIKKNLRVEGWLEAKNIKGPNKGVFTSVAKLKEAYPLPHAGWWALVGDTLPAALYIVDGGEWVATGKNAGNPTIDCQQYNDAVAGLSDDVEEIKTDVSANRGSIEQIVTRINAIGEVVDANDVDIEGLKERIANAEESIATTSQNAFSATNTAAAALQTASEANNTAGTALTNAAIAKERADDARKRVEDIELSVAAPSGIAPLDENGLVPARFIPGAMDDVVEFAGIIDSAPEVQPKGENDRKGCVVYCYVTKKFIWEAARTLDGMATYYNDWDDGRYFGELTDDGRSPVAGKVYIDTTTNKQYRWSGTTMAVVGTDLALGHTAQTAYPGNEGYSLSKQVFSLQQALPEKLGAADKEELEGSIGEVADDVTNVANDLSAYKADVGIYPFAGTIPKAEHVSQKEAGSVWYAAQEGYFVTHTGGTPSHSLPHNSHNDVGGEPLARQDLVYRCGTTFYRHDDSGLVELESSVLRAYITSVKNGAKNELFDLEERLPVFRFDFMVQSLSDIDPGEGIGTIWYVNDEKSFLLVEEMGITDCNHLNNWNTKPPHHARRDAIFYCTGDLYRFDGENLVDWEPWKLRDDVDDLNTALTETANTLNTRIDSHTTDTGIYPFDGTVATVDDIDTATAVDGSVWFLKDDGYFVKVTDDGVDSSIPHNGPRKEHVPVKARGGVLFRQGSQFFRFDGSGLIAVTDDVEVIKRALFDDMWASIYGTKLANGNYRMGADGKELTYAGALVRYERNEFIQKWNNNCVYHYAFRDDRFGKYNEATEAFDLCDIPLSYDEALEIEPWFPNQTMPTYYGSKYCGLLFRSLPAIRCLYNEEYNYLRSFGAMFNLEKLRFSTGIQIIQTVISDATYMFLGCKKLHTIEGVLVVQAKTTNMFGQCYKLRNVQIRTNVSIDFRDCPELSLDSILYMVTNSTPSKAITFTYHPDVYAKLTGDTTNEAAAALTEEELAQWVAITEAAAAKNISFATV